MPKNKPNKGLLKRIRLTKSGKVKLQCAAGRHLASHKSGKLRRSYRAPKYAVGSDARRVAAMLFTRVKPHDAADKTKTDASDGGKD